MARWESCAIVCGLLVAASCGGDSGDGTTTTTTSAPVAVSTTTTTTAPAASASYTVQPGDTLSAIARQFGTTVSAIADANGITDPNVLAIGQTLEIPAEP